MFLAACRAYLTKYLSERKIFGRKGLIIIVTFFVTNGISPLIFIGVSGLLNKTKQTH
jgi:hypothetical protein